LDSRGGGDRDDLGDGEVPLVHDTIKKRPGDERRASLGSLVRASLDSGGGRWLGHGNAFEADLHFAEVVALPVGELVSIEL
jgi:hypothetical protein